MKLKLALLLLLTVISLTSCNSSKSIHLKGSSGFNKDNIPNSLTKKKVDDAFIVHVDQAQRIVTIKSNTQLENGYYYTMPLYSDRENSLIKLYDASNESIYIADILEGVPKITDLISRVNTERSEELDLRFTEATID